MSYDLHLLPKRSGVDLLTAARARLEREGEELNPGPPVPEEEARKARLAEALMQLSPQLSAFELTANVRQANPPEPLASEVR